VRGSGMEGKGEEITKAEEAVGRARAREREG